SASAILSVLNSSLPICSQTPATPTLMRLKIVETSSSVAGRRFNEGVAVDILDEGVKDYNFKLIILTFNVRVC
ncbi:MAG: hypothetical protein AAGA60_13975, partial [Cyanobacteria bacterium P01_E01_bin.42]